MKQFLIFSITQRIVCERDYLSRGCKAEDIVDAVAITAVQSQARKSN